MSDMETVPTVETLPVEDADIFWLLFGAILVFLMQAGFAMLEVGSVRLKNTKNILTKNLLDASIGAILWWLVGYGLAFGNEITENTEFFGENFYALSYTFGRRPSGNTYASWLFQWAFAATATTIVSGAVAERVTMTAYLTYASVLTAFIYPCVVHSAWNSQGWANAFRTDDQLLFDCGVVDFAGSGVVHMTGGVAALVAAVFVGPRKGRFSESGEPQEMVGQSAILRNLGTFILWFGWYGFNGVSTLAINGYGAVAAKTMVTTTIAAGSGCISSILMGVFLNNGIIDLDLAGNGVLAGLVGITAGCSTVEPYGAFVIGVIAGMLYYGASNLLLFLKIDDVVDAVPVHMVCGMWGVLSAGFFATDFNYAAAYAEDRAEDCAGVFYGGDGSTLGANIVFILFVIGWVGGSMSIVFALLKATGLLRVSEEEEEAGLDELHHGGPEMLYSIALQGGASKELEMTEKKTSPEA